MKRDGRTLRRVLLLVLLVLLLFVCVPPQAAHDASPGPPTHRSRPLPLCAPLSSPVEGSWRRNEASPSSPVRLFWTPLHRCRYTVDSPETLFAALDGREVAFIGDSQSREMVKSLVGLFLYCCPAQLRLQCDEAAVRDPAQCAALADAPPYPPAPTRWVLSRGAQRLTITFVWIAHAADLPQEAHFTAPREELNGTTSHRGWVLDFLRGIEHADAVIAAWGLWDLSFDGSRRSDNLVGCERLLEGTAAFAARFAAAADALPGLALRQRFIWRRMYTDEVDVAPHPRPRPDDKRYVPRPWFERAISGMSAIWSGAGVKEWDVSAYVDVWRGNVTRPFNEEFLTYDGQHVFPDVEVVMGWELWSYVAGLVTGGG